MTDSLHLDDMRPSSLLFHLTKRLAYHCLGFDPGCPRGKALSLLRHLRDKGPLTRRELQRHTQSLNADERDKVLARLATEGLIKLDGKKVTAVPLTEFMEALYVRPEFL